MIILGIILSLIANVVAVLSIYDYFKNKSKGSALGLVFGFVPVGVVGLIGSVLLGLKIGLSLGITSFIVPGIMIVLALQM